MGTIIYVGRQTSGGSVWTAQTLDGICGSHSLDAEGDQLPNHGLSAAHPRIVSQLFRRIHIIICAPNVFRRTQKRNLRIMIYFCAYQKIYRRTHMFLRALNKKSAHHNVFTRTANLFLRMAHFVTGTSIIVARSSNRYDK